MSAVMEIVKELTEKHEKRIAELEDALRSIKEVLIKTGPDSAVAKMIIATCDSALGSK